jgi:hypothetical protein
MNWSNAARGAAAVVLLSSASTPAGAMGGVGAGTFPAAHMNDGLVHEVVIIRGPHGAYAGHPGYRPGVHPGYRPGVHPGYGYRPGYPGVRYGGWARPGWYRWGPGGAIAAGAALGVLSAGAVAAWAAPPQPGLCWYYTDPSQRAGFWDVCP